MRKKISLTVFVFFALTAQALAQRAPATPPPEGESAVEAPIAEVGNPATLSNDYIREWGIAPRPDPTVTSTAPTITNSAGQVVPNPNADWNAAQALYQSSATSGTTTTTVTATPAPAAVAPTPKYNQSWQNSDCKSVSRCFASATATTSGQTITTSSAFISFTVPYIVPRGKVFPAKEGVSIWAGISNPNGLWQAGILINGSWDANGNYIPAQTSFTPFWQDYGTAMPYPKQIPGVSVKPGDKVYIALWNVVGTTTLKAQFTNLTTSQSAIVTYSPPHALSHSSFIWAAEATGYPPKFGALQVCGTATDQAGKTYRPGAVTNGNVVYNNMVNTSMSPFSLVPITNVVPGCFIMRAQ